MSELPKGRKIDLEYARATFEARFATLPTEEILSGNFERHALTLARMELSSSHVTHEDVEACERFINNGRLIPPPVPNIDLNTELSEGFNLPKINLFKFRFRRF